MAAWVVNLLSLQPSGMHIQRKGKEQVAQQGPVKKSLVRIIWIILRL